MTSLATCSATPGRRIYDLDRLVCPYLPICDPIVNRMVVRADESHLTPEFAVSLWPAIEDHLTNNGILAG